MALAAVKGTADLRLVIIGPGFPSMWTRKLWLHWIAAIVVQAIMGCVLSGVALHWLFRCHGASVTLADRPLFKPPIR